MFRKKKPKDSEFGKIGEGTYPAESRKLRRHIVILRLIIAILASTLATVVAYGMGQIRGLRNDAEELKKTLSADRARLAELDVWVGKIADDFNAAMADYAVHTDVNTNNAVTKNVLRAAMFFTDDDGLIVTKFESDVRYEGVVKIVNISENTHVKDLTICLPNGAEVFLLSGFDKSVSLEYQSLGYTIDGTDLYGNIIELSGKGDLATNLGGIYACYVPESAYILPITDRSWRFAVNDEDLLMAGLGAYIGDLYAGETAELHFEIETYNLLAEVEPPIETGKGRE